MRDRSSTIRIVELSDIGSNLAEIVDEVSRQESRVIVEQAGTPVAAVVSAEDLRRLDRFDRAWAGRTRALETFGTAFADEPTAEIEERVGRIVAQPRRAGDGVDPPRAIPAPIL